MPKLTDTQLVILSTASQRDGGTVHPLPKSPRAKGAALTKVLEGLLKKGLLQEKPAPRNAESWREADDGQRMMLVITEPGLEAIDGEPAGEASKPPPRDRSSGKNANTREKPARRRSTGAQASPSARDGTKQGLLIDLLKRKNGATIEEIVEATGWQAHSVRGAISGTLKKKLGLSVSSEKVKGGGRVYRIAREA